MSRLRSFLDGSRPADPFYLTNRTIGQKIRLAIVIMLPCLLVVGGIGLALAGYLNRPLAPPPPAPALSPNKDLNIGDLKIESNRDIEIADVHIEQGTVTKVAGMARNYTNHVAENTELIFDLTDKDGSRLGAVATTIARIEAGGSARFSFPVEQHEAAFALVREIRQ